MTLAPQSASWRAQVGPARTRVRSSTVKRASAFDARGKDKAGLHSAFRQNRRRCENLVDPSGVVHRLKRRSGHLGGALSKGPRVAIFPARRRTIISAGVAWIGAADVRIAKVRP